MKFPSPLIRSLLILIVVAGNFSCSDSERSADKQDPAQNTPDLSLNYEKELQFLDPDGSLVSTIDIAIADDNMERNQGLMDVRSLPENSGMLFIFPDEQPRSFWMANTPLPLDIIYVAADSTVVRVYPQTKPFSQESLPSGAPAKYVVEVNGGYTISRDIREGYRIRF